MQKIEEYKAQVKLLKHSQIALCDCEITEKGRSFLKTLENKLTEKINDTIGDISNSKQG